MEYGFYQYALDSNENIVHAADAKTENSYYCLSCKSKMVLPNEAGCYKHYIHDDLQKLKIHKRSESDLHYNVKWSLFNLIKQKIALNEEIHIVPRCPESEESRLKTSDDYAHDGTPINLLRDPPFALTIFPPSPLCEKYYLLEYGEYEPPSNFINLYFRHVPLSYKYPLIEGADEIIVEKSLDGFRPDLSLFKNGDFFKSIEVVYKSDDSIEKTNYYEDNEIDVIKIYVCSYPHMERIRMAWSYLPLTFVSLTINKNRRGKEGDDSDLIHDEVNNLKPDIYYKMINQLNAE